jgi:hypothetical protein
MGLEIYVYIIGEGGRDFATVRLRIGYRLFLYRDMYRDNIGIDIIGYDFENNRYNRLCFSI